PPDGLGRKNEMDAWRDIVFKHAVERHLSVPYKTKHEAPAGEHNALSLDTDLMLLSLADDRVVRVPVGGVPVWVFLADPVDDSPAILLRLLHETVDSGLGDGGMIKPVEVGTADEEQLLPHDLPHGTVRDRRNRRLSATCDLDADSSL